MGRSFLETNSFIDGKLFKKARLKNGKEIVNGIITWTGLSERYFSIFLKPYQEVEGAIRNRVMPTYRESFQVALAKLGDDATALGAAAWAEHRENS